MADQRPYSERIKGQRQSTNVEDRRGQRSAVYDGAPLTDDEADIRFLEDEAYGAGREGLEWDSLNELGDPEFIKRNYKRIRDAYQRGYWERIRGAQNQQPGQRGLGLQRY